MQRWSSSKMFSRRAYRFIPFADATLRNSIKHVRLISYAFEDIFDIVYVKLWAEGRGWGVGWDRHLARETIFYTSGGATFSSENANVFSSVLVLGHVILSGRRHSPCPSSLAAHSWPPPRYLPLPALVDVINSKSEPKIVHLGGERSRFLIFGFLPARSSNSPGGFRKYGFQQI